MNRAKPLIRCAEALPDEEIKGEDGADPDDGNGSDHGSASGNGDAAIHGQDLSGDNAGVVAAEIDRHAGDITRPAGAEKVLASQSPQLPDIRFRPACRPPLPENDLPRIGPTSPSHPSR